MPIETADIAEAKPSSSYSPKKSAGRSGIIHLPTEYDELRLYALLKWHFGKPNGPLTFVDHPGGNPDGPFKWDFLFNPYKNLKLHIIRKANVIEIWWWDGKANEQQIQEYLDRNLNKYSVQIDNEIQTLEKYTLILNPYVRHRSIVEFAKRELENIRIHKPSIPRGIKTKKKTIEKYAKQQQIYMNKVDNQASITLLLVIESAFMAEAYLNLIYAILLRSEIKTSKSILNETLLRKWRSKVERLPVDCKYIKGHPDMGDVRVRDTKKLFNLRNKVAHSYPDREEMKVGEMWFQESIPILSKAVPFNDYTVALHNQLPSVDDAIFCAKSAYRFIDYLTELIDDDIRNQFKDIAESNPLGYNDTKDIYGIPFSDSAIIYTGLVPRVSFKGN